MPAIPKIPETTTEYQSIIAYLQSKEIPKTIEKILLLNSILFVVANDLKRMKTESCIFL
jgi:hypothetical protein